MTASNNAPNISQGPQSLVSFNGNFPNNIDSSYFQNVCLGPDSCDILNEKIESFKQEKINDLVKYERALSYISYLEVRNYEMRNEIMYLLDEVDTSRKIYNVGLVTGLLFTLITFFSQQYLLSIFGVGTSLTAVVGIRELIKNGIRR